MSKIKNFAIRAMLSLALVMPTCSPDPAFPYDPTAKQVKTTTTSFSGNLSSSDDTVQKALDTIDNLPISGASFSVVTATSSYPITTDDDVVLGNTTSGGFTVTLPTAVGSEKQYTIKRIGTGNNNLTIATTSSQTIDGDLTVELIVTNTSITVVSDNSNWRIC